MTGILCEHPEPYDLTGKKPVCMICGEALVPGPNGGMFSRAQLVVMVNNADAVKELDRIMPESKGSWHYDKFYECKICGSLVVNRMRHLRFHKGADMLDVLVKLFGRPPFQDDKDSLT